MTTLKQIPRILRWCVLLAALAIALPAVYASYASAGIDTSPCARRC
jgi:hypothetical protein